MKTFTYKSFAEEIPVEGRTITFFQSGRGSFGFTTLWEKVEKVHYIYNDIEEDDTYPDNDLLLEIGDYIIHPLTSGKDYFWMYCDDMWGVVDPESFPNDYSLLLNSGEAELGSIEELGVHEEVTFKQAVFSCKGRYWKIKFTEPHFDIYQAEYLGGE